VGGSLAPSSSIIMPPPFNPKEIHKNSFQPCTSYLFTVFIIMEIRMRGLP
jgi:hypothetical protein